MARIHGQNDGAGDRRRLDGGRSSRRSAELPFDLQHRVRCAPAFRDGISTAPFRRRVPLGRRSRRATVRGRWPVCRLHRRLHGYHRAKKGEDTVVPSDGMTAGSDVANAPLDLEALRRWIGKTAIAEDQVTSTPARALAATLDLELSFHSGDPLPQPWHWLYFLTMEPLADTGPDGHPKRGGFLPPVPLPRRMWAGSRMEFFRPLRIGDAIRRESRIATVTAKEGRSGTLVFVTVRHEIFSGNERLLSDEHDIVYRDLDRGGSAPGTRVAPNDHHWIRQIDPTPVLLFRYSALTFNSHRIHYDYPYVTGVEGYPGLIVHGPLLATLLLDLLSRQVPDARVTHFQFRAVGPLFDNAPFAVCGRPDAATNIALWAKGDDGRLAMVATATLA